MFYLWDSVFSRDKRPLQDFLKSQSISLITYYDFVNCTEEFLLKIYDHFRGNKMEQNMEEGYSNPVRNNCYDLTVPILNERLDDIPF